MCAVEFSFDSQYLVAVGCDDYHMVGVFNLLNGEKVCEATGQKGTTTKSTFNISKLTAKPCLVTVTVLLVRTSAVDKMDPLLL